MFKSVSVLIAGALILSSCATQLHRGVVAMKIDESTAHVGLNATEVKVGDHVQLYGSKCTQGNKGTPTKCTKFSKGHGVVTEALSADYVAVKFDSGVAFQEGDFIEKHSH